MPAAVRAMPRGGVKRTASREDAVRAMKAMRATIAGTPPSATAAAATPAAAVPAAADASTAAAVPTAATVPAAAPNAPRNRGARTTDPAAKRKRAAAGAAFLMTGALDTRRRGVRNPDALRAGLGWGVPGPPSIDYVGSKLLTPSAGLG